jgi:hypothetical protein
MVTTGLMSRSGGKREARWTTGTSERARRHFAPARGRRGRGERVSRSAWTLRAALVLMLLSPRQARAESLQVSAARVAEAWRDDGAFVVRDEARFLSDGETLKIKVPSGESGSPDMPGANVPVGNLPRNCQSIAFIGARGLSFHASLAPEDPADERIASVAGILELTSCGAAPFLYVWIKSDAGRGAIETVAAFSAEPPTSPSAVLLDRTGGVLPPAPEPGALPPLPTPEKRAETAEARARREGTRAENRASWTAGPDGKGEGRLVLEAGCHRIELFANENRVRKKGRFPRLDLDATLRDEDGLLLAHDHSSAPDVRIDVCVGEATTSVVLFEGAPSGSSVTLTHAWLPLSEHLPLTFGRSTRARMAAALWPRHIGGLGEDAVLLAQGASGITPIPVEVEPGGCYVAVVALEQGHARGLGLRAKVGERESVDERGTNDDASAVAFCAEDRDRAHLEVDARSTGVSWGLALFRVASGVWERAR